MAETKSFAEIQEIAHRLHPQATARLTYDQRWEIIVPTGFEQTYELGSEFDGTPAAEAHATYASGESELERWARKNYHGDEPLELAARWFNLDYSRRVDSISAFDAALAERGLPPVLKTDFQALTREEYEAFKALRQQVLAELEPRWQAEEQALKTLTYGE